MRSTKDEVRPPQEKARGRSPGDRTPALALTLEERHRRRRQRRAYQTAVIFITLLFLPIAFISAAGNSYVRSIADVPAEPVGIIFGAAEKNDEPSPYVVSRLDVAINLWHAGKIKIFLVTGDNQDITYNETQAMHDYLVDHGVPDKIIVIDPDGFDTWQSCIRAKEVFGINQAILISQSFHVPRAVMLCRAAGITAYGVGDGDRGWWLGKEQYLHDNAREVLASFNALYQMTFQPGPNVQGNGRAAISAALRAAG
jgi:vancomycin permeability regulator SanA